jgi:hypothetical protein
VNDASRRSVRTLLQIGVVEGVLQLLQCFLEDHTNMPALLKAPASEGQNPTPTDAGTP